MSKSVRIAGIAFTRAAAENIAETGIEASEIQSDVRNIRNGDLSKARLLMHCLNGAGEDRREGWRDYVSAVVAAAEVEKEGRRP